MKGFEPQDEASMAELVIIYRNHGYEAASIKAAEARDKQLARDFESYERHKRYIRQKYEDAMASAEIGHKRDRERAMIAYETRVGALANFMAKQLRAGKSLWDHYWMVC